jgi:tetratricopeptide (TPR) repeat protein
LRSILLAALTGGTLLAGSPPAGAQAPDGHEQPSHEHAKEQLGKVNFPISCTAEAGRRFQRGMAALHSFWWDEAEAAFHSVLQTDPACGMAYWGLALNAWGNPFAGGPAGSALSGGADAAVKAESLSARTPRERGFIAAAGALYRGADQTTNAVRLQSYADTMAGLYRRYPKDTEVAIYYALALLATAPKTDTTYAQQKRAAAILNPLFARYPQHPGLAHYIIHATDSPRLAHLGLTAARKYARIAPAAPHAQHMPSHIFIRLGYWDETVASNLAAYHAGMAYAEAKAHPPVGEQLHAMDYAVYAYLQEGRDSAARAAVATAQRLPIPPSKGLVGDYNRIAMAARIPLETGDWKSAALFPVATGQGLGTVVMLSRFTRAIGAARSGDPGRGRSDVAALDSLAKDLASRKESYWSRVTAIKRDAALAWVMLAEGDTVGGIDLARAAADSEEVTDKHPVTPAELVPARELQADMLLQAGRYSEARKAYQTTLKREPGRARSIFGAARSAELAGDRQAATNGYREFMELMRKGDGARPELAAARKFIGA